MSNDMTASQQWAVRPDDERFLTLEELRASVALRKEHSWTATPKPSTMRIVPANRKIEVEVFDPTAGQKRLLATTNWSFTQLAQLANAPASFLRKLPPELVAINLQWGLERMAQREDPLLLAHSNGDNTLRAITSSTYGRIYDQDVVDAVIRVNEDGRWQVPAASYATTNPKRATTLYASDRDVFIFLVDPNHEIDVKGEKLYRGFYAYNSEVGAATFGLCTFLYRYICDNRIIWGQTQVNELKIRHTGGAPARFAYEGANYLKRYAEESTQGIVATIEAAQEKKVPVKKGQSVGEWLQDRGFTKAQASASVESAKREEGEAKTLWQIINGVTAYARGVAYTDDRVELESKAGKLMQFVDA